jgi:hypothetical protein
LARAYGCIPVSVQRWKTSMLTAGQAPSQGMVPSCAAKPTG